MRAPTVPVSHESAWSTSLEAEGFRVTHASFAPGLRIAPHVHDRACIAVMLEGSFSVDFGGTVRACREGETVIEPAARRHGNLVERGGARVLVLQPDPDRLDPIRSASAVIDRIGHLTHPGMVRAAWGLARELRAPDRITPLAAEALAIEMLCLAARIDLGAAAGVRPPRWLKSARDLLHARFREPLRLGDVARAAGVHAVHLARVFRAHHRRSIGDYVRDLRVEWAAQRLLASEDPLADIALQAGFADQSHFTRVFRARRGVTPGRYRRDAGG